MRNTLGKIALFIGGAMIGSAVTYKYLVNKYEALIEEEVESVKATYEILHEETLNKERMQLRSDALESARKISAQVAKDMEKFAHTKAEKEEYNKIVSFYIKDDKLNTEEDINKDEEEEGNDMVQPYTIHPDEFGDTEYDQKCLTLYKDGVIEDDYGDIWEDEEINRMLGGEENLKRMGEFEDDMLYIRNDNVKIDYEIARDLSSYFGEEE